MKSIPEESKQNIETLNQTLERLDQFPFYEETIKNAEVKPGNIQTFNEFRQIPLMDAEELAHDFQQYPPYGSLIADDTDILRVNFTPNPHMDDMLPVPVSRKEIERSTSLYKSLGITSDDVVISTATMTPYPMGWGIAKACEELGATLLPVGPGKSRQKVQQINKFDATVLVGFPSFLLQIADRADSQDMIDSVELLIATGEPFTAIDGYRDEVRAAYGGKPTVVDGYGSAEVGGVAHETLEEDGMEVFTDTIFPEVIDPETGELVDEGQKGELVVTHIGHNTPPVLRFRTHDLTKMEHRDTGIVLPEGVFGRTDRMVKIKGVKIYPDEIALHLTSLDGIQSDNFKFEVTQPDRSTHHLAVTAKGDPSIISEKEIKSEIRDVANITADDITISPGIETDEKIEIIHNENA